MLKTKEIEHNGHRFKVHFDRRDILVVRSEQGGYAAHISVGRFAPPDFPYYYTRAEPGMKRNEIREVPAASLTEAVRGCCDGIIELSRTIEIRNRTDRGEAVRTMRSWFDDLPDPEETGDQEMSGVTLE